MKESYQENNLDVGGRLTWRMAPIYDINTKMTPPFVITESGRFFARPKFYSKREGVEGYLFIYTQFGKGLLKYRGGEYELLPGSIALIDCNQRHEYRTYDEENGNWTFYWLHCLNENLNFYTHAIYGDSFFLLKTGEKTPRIFEDVINNLQYSDPGSLFKLHESVNSLLALMIETAQSEKPISGKKTEKREIIKIAAKYLKDNHWQPFDLDELAKQFNMSKYYFVRLFKEHTGMTPHNFVTAERLNVSKILLQSTEEPISKICLITGFTDESNFTRKFRELTGETPGTYRLKMKK